MATLTNPYGTNPASPPTCPVNFTPTYVDGWGWTCAETPTGYSREFQQFLDLLGPDGVSIPATGLIPTLSVSAQVRAIQQALEHRYPGAYVVLPQNENLLILAASRAAAEGLLPAPVIGGIGGDDALNAQSEAEAQGYAAQYARQYHWPYQVVRVTWPPDGLEFVVHPVTSPAAPTPTGDTGVVLATYPG
jgi:hypothetical protein